MNSCIVLPARKSNFQALRTHQTSLTLSGEDKTSGKCHELTANVAVQQQIPATSSGNTKSNDQTLNSSSEGMNVQTRPYYQGHNNGGPQVGHPGFTGLNTQGNLAGSGGFNVSAHIPFIGMPPAHAGTSHIAAYNCSMLIVSNLSPANPYVMSYNNGNPFASGASSLCPGSTQAISEGNRISQCVQATPAVVTDPAWYPDTGATGYLAHDSKFLQQSNPATGVNNWRSIEMRAIRPAPHDT
ncbi:hypothetical protein GOBAR_DD27467 [Gossypium barbadense]|nr:hypothetical protein GOBAR_DD27467 [Gossypium barbadense]